MGMQVGGKRKLLMPANLAYGECTMGMITPNSSLTSEIELLEVLARDEWRDWIFPEKADIWRHIVDVGGLYGARLILLFTGNASDLS